MKKIILFQLALGFLVLCSSFTPVSKKLTEGKLIFDITYPGADLDQQTMAMLPSESTIYFKGQMSRTEIKMPMGNTIAITDGKAEVTTTLMDLMGNKIAVKFTKEDLEKENKKLGKEKPVIKITDETKVISGYTCKKAIVTAKDADQKEITFDVWFTKEISSPNSMRNSGLFESIDGFLMVYETKMNDMTMKMTCRSAEQISVDDSLFIVPDGYKVTTMDELKNTIGGH